MIKRTILFTLPLLAACATAGASPAQLQDTRWAFTSIDGKAPVSSKASLSIEAERVGANAGCNGMGGDLRLTEDKLVTGPIISTQMYCDGVMEQERAVAGLLDADPVYALKGDKLVLEGGGHRAELKRVN
ncbi:META domain-containing protein [Novosphingobium sp.]|uniref:META domain-containing protein n=1 Tax=Novosphingobium sp. TaxID=1874826 RepID=UPI00286CF70C|nr:META domain-containing protein [Novosphingobium sp.]